MYLVCSWFIINVYVCMCLSQVNTVFLALVLFSIAKNRTNRQRKMDEGYKVDLAT